MRAVAALCLVLALALPARAQDAPNLSPADRAAIQQVITGQVEAFRRDDDAGAFAFATPTLQSMFGTPGNFMGMVRNGYQPVYRPRAFAFAPPVTEDGELIQPVDVIGPDGAPRTALYTMERQPDGTWRIAGCRLVERVTPET